MTQAGMDEVLVLLGGDGGETAAIVRACLYGGNTDYSLCVELCYPRRRSGRLSYAKIFYDPKKA